ncbi:hypothetical protein [Bradyrhizobium sp.]
MPHPRLLNLSGMAVSIAAHLTVLTVGLGYAGVRPFETAPVEAIAVDLVTPAEVKEAMPEAPPKPTPLEIPDPSTTEQPAAAAQPVAPPPQQTVAMPTTTSAAAPKAEAKQAALQPAAAASSPAPQSSWRPPEPDLSVKYQVNLGLPARLGGDDFDASAMSIAKVETGDIAKFRDHLKTCSILPAGVAPTDNVRIVMRATFIPDGHLRTAPILIEASASAKGPLLMQAATKALQQCQPYAVLPADKYDEWKVLDLSFTPRDFRGG